MKDIPSNNKYKTDFPNATIDLERLNEKFNPRVVSNTGTFSVPFFRKQVPSINSSQGSLLEPTVRYVCNSAVPSFPCESYDVLRSFHQVSENPLGNSNASTLKRDAFSRKGSFFDIK